MNTDDICSLQDEFCCQKFRAGGGECELSGNDGSVKQPRSCGFLIVSGMPVNAFLLMKHPDRWDLPKGHVDPGETDLECALRELEEETGFTERELIVDPDFRYEHRYLVSPHRYSTGKSREKKQDPVEKTLLIFLAMIDKPRAPLLTEHIGYEWFDWKPPHRIQERTIDPLLAHLASHLVGDGNGNGTIQ